AADLAGLRARGTAGASAPVRGGGAVCWFVASAAEDADGDPVPAAVYGAVRVRVRGDDAARLRALVAAVETHGPVPVPESAAARMAAQSGVRRARAPQAGAGGVGRWDP
ncbi:hypothetical protein, partial [Streptomyces sp. NPDC059552]|uniref:hypothetical protein n=1 Tax=Streptomyces sp. NPDC059552 TaxID=3346862 RepID=UPI0036CF2CAF